MEHSLPEKMVEILRKYRLTEDRSRLITALLDTPAHHVIWISSWWDYRDMDQILGSLGPSKSHTIIYQTEEDWFHNMDFTSTRIKIKNHPRWTDQSFIITNSRQDKVLTTRLGIKIKCRPGLLDLITYQPYGIGSLENTVSDIRYHTGMCLSRVDHDRCRLKTLLDENNSKVMLSVLGNHGDLPEQYRTESPDVPFSPMTADSWIKNTAFGAVLETQHRKSRLGFVNAPVLSEKTYKIMHFHRPAVICGGQHTRQYLRDLGFDTWDWLVDWEFDRESDDDVRFDKFLIEVKRLLDMPLSQLVQQIKLNQDRLLHNRDRLFWLINNHDCVDI
jgi:hypothetical protein